MKISQISTFTSPVVIFASPSEGDGSGIYNLEGINTTQFLPFEAKLGVETSIKFRCSDCEEKIQIQFQRINLKLSEEQIDLSFLNDRRYSDDFMNAVSNAFNFLSADAPGIKKAYTLRSNQYAKVLFLPCTKCESQYLLSYKDSFGTPFERGVAASPSTVYLDEIVQVELDIEELKREMGLKKN